MLRSNSKQSGKSIYMTIRREDDVDGRVTFHQESV